MSADLSRRLLKAYLDTNYEIFLQRNSAELTRTAWDAVHLVATYGFIPILTATSELFIVVGLLTVVAVKAPILTLLAMLVTGSALTIAFRFIHPRLHAISTAHEEIAASLFRQMQQSLGGAREVRLSHSESYFIDKLGAEQVRMADGMSSQSVLLNVPRILLETIFALFILLFVAVAALTDRLDAGTVALLGLFAYVVLRLMPSINRVSSGLNSLRSGAAAIDTVSRDLARYEPASSDARPSIDVLHLKDRIEIDDVSYHYPNHDEGVLSHISLTIRRGQSIGLVGPTGAGKSTLVDLLLGLLQPTGGRVLVDEIDLARRATDWQRSLGVVSQTVFLLDDSLQRNIAFGTLDDEIDEDKVLQAVNMAQLDDFVASLPEGLDTAVGERGVRLSGGQRQRVAIARALYRQPDVVIFDEGTSALDSLTEGEVIAAVDRLRGQRTLIMVAHRLTTVRRCDLIVLIEHGAITARGTYNELLESSVSFRQMAL